jgi:hypothetical protein
VTPAGLAAPSGEDNTVKVPSKPGLLGLLGLLGLIGLIGVIPAVLSIPAGVVLIGSLLLAPTGTTVPDGTSVGTLITNCINNVPVTDIAILRSMNKGLEDTILQQIAVAGVCLPGGAIFNSNTTADQVADLPPGAVFVGNNNSTSTVILPPGSNVCPRLRRDNSPVVSASSATPACKRACNCSYLPALRVLCMLTPGFGGTLLVLGRSKAAGTYILSCSV